MTISGEARGKSGRCRKRILIISSFYAPEEIGIAPYTTGLAEQLAADGHQVTVLTGMPSYPQWRIYPEYRGRFRKQEQRGQVDVRRVRNYVPHGQSALQRGIYEASFLLAGPTALTMPRPDAILAVVPSLSGGILARVAARHFGCLYGIVFQDLTGPAAHQSGAAGYRTAGMVSAIEGWVARESAAIGIISEGFRPYMESLGIDTERIHRVRNWVQIEEPKLDMMASRQRFGFPPEAVICLHAGNMGLKQGLGNIVECARLAVESDPHLLFVLLGDGSQRSHLAALAQCYGLPNLRFLPTQPAELLPDLLAAADILLLNQRASVTSMSLPSKLTSYMASGRPVVAAVQSNSEAALEVGAAKAGTICSPDNPRAMLSTLRHLASNPSLREKLGANGTRYCKQQLHPQTALPQWLMLVACLTDDPRRIAPAPGPSLSAQPWQADALAPGPGSSTSSRT
jgi:colanic acid biosynthesis glycosyl transferase WcaI